VSQVILWDQGLLLASLQSSEQVVLRLQKPEVTQLSEEAKCYPDNVHQTAGCISQAVW
jgi:hypothetical protein